MALVYEVNLTPTTGGQAVQYLIKNAILTGYWEGHAWGGGTGGHARSTDFTTGADGVLYSGALDGALAWVAIKKVGASRTILFQHHDSSDHTKWYIGYAESGLDVGAGIGDEDTPDADLGSDMIEPLATLAEATFPIRFPPDGTYSFHCVGDSLWFYAMSIIGGGTPTAKGMILFEETADHLSIDTTPFVVQSCYGTYAPGVSYFSGNNYAGSACWVDYAGTGVVPTKTPPKTACAAQTCFLTSLGTTICSTPVFSSTLGFRSCYTRYFAVNTSNEFLLEKGTSAVILYKPSSTVTTGSVLDDPDTGLAYAVWGDMMFQWPSGVPLTT